jgi:hypothetical protein
MTAARFTALLLLASAAALCGCGSPGAPQPPSLKIPVQVTDLSAYRAADNVHLHWTMPRRATDRVLLVGDQRVSICRSLKPGPCVPSGQLLLQPAAAADDNARLPPELAHGDPRLLIYTVELSNHRGYAAGQSNPAYTAAGSAPAPLGPVTATASADGIALRWSETDAAMSPSTRIRLHRSRILQPGESPRPGPEETRAGVPQPLEQTLEMRQAATPGQALDTDALLDRTYRYTLERIVHLDLANHAFDVSGPSSTAMISARDVFPPAVPQGLEAVADNDSGAIDLSWTPNTERDLAGYFVYRRPSGDPGQPVRVSGQVPVDSPAWRDTSADRTTRYAYSVSAVDRDGNESPRSPETEEGLAAPQ